MSNSSNKNMYKATIGDRELMVDIYNLPYDEFSAETPLVINGRVILSDKERSTDLTNVCIHGSLDISKQKVSVNLPKYMTGRFICHSCDKVRDKNNPKNKIDLFSDDFVFPEGINIIDCSHSIKDLSFFIDKIPESVDFIWVADTVLLNMKKDPKRVEGAKRFRERYPFIDVICSAKGLTILDDILDPKSEEKSPETTSSELVPSEPVEATKKPDALTKTDEFCDMRDLREMFRLDSKLNIPDITDDILERSIRKLMKKFNKHFRMNIETGAKIVCIEKSYAPQLLAELNSELQHNTKTEEKSEQSIKSEDVEQSTKSEKNKEKTDKSITPIIIKKYIPKYLWKDITKACNRNANTIRSVLETIACVNVNPNETKTGLPLQIIDLKNNARTTCSYLQKENGNCIVQSTNNTISNDRKRIVWSYLPKEQILVCVKVYAEHYCITKQNKESLKYARTLDCAAKSHDNDNVKITVNKIIHNDYLDVDDLLTQYPSKEPKEPIPEITEPEQPAQTKPVVPAIKREPRKAFSRPVINVKQNPKKAFQKATEASKPTKTITETRPNTEEQKPISIVHEPTIIKTGKTPKDLTDIYAMETYLNQFMKMLEKTIEEGLSYISSESDAAKQLNTLDNVREALVQKAKIQAMINEFGKTTELMKIIQSNINSRTK